MTIAAGTQVDLESGQVEPVNDPPPPPPAAEGEQQQHAGEDPPPAEPEGEQPPASEQAQQEARRGSMLADLIGERKERQRLEGLVAGLQQSVERLQQPAQRAEEQEREQAELLETAQQLRLVTTDAHGTQVWDLEAAKRVNAWGQGLARKVARAEVQPVHQMTMTERATANKDTAVRFAADNGWSPEAQRIIAKEFEAVLSQPNGAAMLANPQVAETVWFTATGKAANAGHTPSRKAGARGAAPQMPPQDGGGPPPLPAPPGGRRPAAAISLTPRQQQVYQDAGMDPNKPANYTRDNTGAVEL